MKIPVCSINIGPIHKKDIMKSIKNLQGTGTRKEFASILAFDVKVSPDAQEFADENGVRVFTANIIYHLFDDFTEYAKKCDDDRKNQEGKKAIFPCLVEMVRGAIFNTKNPIIMGVTIKAGILKVGTPLCIPAKEKMLMGKVESIEKNKQPITWARSQHGEVAIKINNDHNLMYGRHFDDTDEFASMLNRDSIDALKKYFREDMQDTDWKLVIQLKKTYGIL